MDKPVAWADAFDIERERHDFWVSRQKPARDGVPLYRSPQREWMGLTAEEAAQCWNTSVVQTWANIDAKLKEKNDY